MQNINSSGTNDPEASSLFIVCCRPLISEAFQQLIESPTVIVAGKGTTFADVLRARASGLQLHLAVSLLDSDREAEDTLLQFQQVRDQLGCTKSMVVTKSPLQPTILRRAVQLGIGAILTTEVSADILQHAIELVLLGQRVLPAQTTEPLDVAPLLPQAHPRPAMAPILRNSKQRTATLSQREHQILQRLVNGCSNKVIARDLNITEATVKVHLKALLRKTQMTNRTQAAIWALNNGFGGALPKTDSVDQPALNGQSGNPSMPKQMLGGSSQAAGNA